MKRKNRALDFPALVFVSKGGKRKYMHDGMKIENIIPFCQLELLDMSFSGVGYSIAE